MFSLAFPVAAPSSAWAFSLSRINKADDDLWDAAMNRAFAALAHTPLTGDPGLDARFPVSNGQDGEGGVNAEQLHRIAEFVAACVASVAPTAVQCKAPPPPANAEDDGGGSIADGATPSASPASRCLTDDVGMTRAKADTVLHNWAIHGRAIMAARRLAGAAFVTELSNDVHVDMAAAGGPPTTTHLLTTSRSLKGANFLRYHGSEVTVAEGGTDGDVRWVHVPVAVVSLPVSGTDSAAAGRRLNVAASAGTSDVRVDDVRVPTVAATPSTASALQEAGGDGLHLQTLTMTLDDTYALLCHLDDIQGAVDALSAPAAPLP